ncbi:ERBB receptor feedback inhibitor 1 [Cheilinus undulatus]|uniref:ERBB receptor feedback inhibitor 1 n=1 Tax=Cheilinus undulatus TaxID=241271 RepID=UPI001BD594A6|nr:ERBB receptor feedback inhibitor 1 [Cheilinus undulatus]
MTRSETNYWRQHDLNRACFGLSADMECNLTKHLQQQMSKEFNCNLSSSQPSFYNDTCRQRPDITLHSLEEDQVVPFSLRRTILGGLQREAKPLPPLPDPEELISDEAADSEVEFFISDRRHLLPKSCPKATCKITNRESGQVNYAYQKGLVHGCSAGISSMAFSWPCSEERATGMENGFGSNIWSLTFQKEDQSEQNQSSRLRYSYTGTAFQPLYSSNTTCPAEKPKVPLRIPIPPKPLALLKTLSVNEEDKPPKIPPRIPLVPPCPPRTPSPKSLPIYINGVMPATQSFAANPKYVSKAFQRQQSERVTPAAQSTPCIVPILKDGRQTSATHYILLPPGRQAYSDR